MATLRDEQRAIPGGYTFFEPSTKWQPAPFSSLDSITMQLIGHRRGRPDLVARNGWSLDPAVVRQEVVRYNVAVCVRNNWLDYIVGSAETVPFRPPTPPPATPIQKLRNVAAGSSTLVSWLQDGAPTVSQELANPRAANCATCPMNGKGGWEAYFTVPVANAIRREVERKKEMKLETPSDENMGVCEACSCPTTLKVWLRIEDILKKMPPAQFDALAPGCWIRAEKEKVV